jgi:hypothetical protein
MQIADTPKQLEGYSVGRRLVIHWPRPVMAAMRLIYRLVSGGARPTMRS